MKNFNSKILGLTALLSIFSLWSCSDDIQPATEVVTQEDVPAVIEADFTRSYPNATNVAWTISSEYAVASFVTNVTIAESAQYSTVWYMLSDNQKKMHSSTILFTELPAAVTDAFFTSEYATLTPAERAHVITRYVNGDLDRIYVIKAKGTLEDSVSTVVKLYYTETGTLVKLSSETVYDESFADHDDIDEFHDWLPQTPGDFVSEYVDTHYPGARYLYIHKGHDITKVKILDRYIARLLLFDANGAWISTATEIDDDDIPAEILAAFRASEYAGWHIEKVVEYFTASDGHYYILSLEKGKEKAELRLEADGTVSDTPDTPSEPVNPGTSSDDTTYLSKTEIEGFILAKYPGASVLKYDYDDQEAEVEITYNRHKIKVEFELHPQGYTWSHSEWDFDVRDTSTLPALILKTISDKYDGYRLEYLAYHETPTLAPYYEAGLKSSQPKKTLTVKIDEQGNVIAEYGKH